MQAHGETSAASATRNEQLSKRWGRRRWCCWWWWGFTREVMYAPCAAGCVTRGAYTSYMPRGFQSRAFSATLVIHICTWRDTRVHGLRMCAPVSACACACRACIWRNRIANFFSCRERHFMSLCCLHDRAEEQPGVVEKIMESRYLWVAGTLINGRLKWLCIVWTCVSRAQMDGELRDKF